jgi:hypothetical protein
MKIMDLLDDVFFESVEISPVLAQISPALAQRKSPETGNLSPVSPVSPFSPTPPVIPVKSEKENDPGRTWAPGNPFVCDRGFSTGWLRDGKPLCPACDGKHPAGIPEAAKMNSDNQGRPSTGPCLICGVPLDQDGGDCWHLAFHLGECASPKLDPLRISDDSAKLSSPTHSPKRGKRISSVALAWLQNHRQALRQAGWTGRELYRRNKSKGIGWCALWDAPFLKVYLHENGVIEFECVIAGKDIIQTARPMHQARKIFRRK